MSRRLVSKAGELRRLAFDESDWNFDRVRRSRGGDADGAIIEAVPESVVLADEQDAMDILASEEDDTVAETVAPPLPTKPTHSRVILEVSQLQQAFASYPCPECSEVLELKIRGHSVLQAA
jgi:hypothetical protein